MTMDADPEEAKYLVSEIFKSNNPVTYHSLSRSLNVHINHAKELLLEFYNKNKQQLTASFIITGNGSNSQLIKLAKDETELLESVKAFDHIHTVHVYSVSDKSNMFTIDDIAQFELKWPNKREEYAKYYQNGMIKGPELKDLDFETVDVSEKETSKKDSLAPVQKDDKIKREKENKEPKKAPTRSSTLSGYVSRKGESKTRQAKRPATDPTPRRYEYKSRKVEAKEPKERVVISNAVDSGAVSDDEPAPPKKSKKSDLENIFDDDFSDNELKVETEEKEHPIFVEEDAEEDEIPKNKSLHNELSNPEPKEEQSKELKSENGEEPLLLLNEGKAHEPETYDEPEPTVTNEDTPDDEGYFTTYRDGAKKEASLSKPSLRSKLVTPSHSGSKHTSKRAPDKKKTQASLMSFFQKR
ncbi:uncharacterized protein PRCAT00002149001 [Priceomyces carsonii]|uniref:uncharacterized protein n=1 Tax=Priceomyces carsonii TaxID=28549 RepID=UPI002ED808F3|nr:unnamed protein product [Priceomyces carsonii]